MSGESCSCVFVVTFCSFYYLIFTFLQSWPELWPIFPENEVFLAETFCINTCSATHTLILCVCVSWNKTDVTQKSKNGLEKIGGTRNVIFRSTAFGKNN